MQPERAAEKAAARENRSTDNLIKEMQAFTQAINTAFRLQNHPAVGEKLTLQPVCKVENFSSFPKSFHDCYLLEFDPWRLYYHLHGIDESIVTARGVFFRHKEGGSPELVSELLRETLKEAGVEG